MATHAYIDGACSGNPGPGGWGVVIVGAATQQPRDLSGYDPETTNNRMELTAAIMLLKSISPDVYLVIHADSQYVIKGVTEWMAGWKKRNWRKSSGGEVENLDLWKELDGLINQRISESVTWTWVKGHAGDEFNERADRLATNAIEEFRATGQVKPDPIATVSDDTVISYTRHTGSWYGHLTPIDCDDEFMIRFERKDFSQEFAIEVHSFERGDSALRICIYGEAMGEIHRLPKGFLTDLGKLDVEKKGTINGDAVEGFLNARGIVDATARIRTRD